MGITAYNQTSTLIKYDPLLSWPVPLTWSLKDATTVPLTYATVIRLLINHMKIVLIKFFNLVLLRV